MLIYANVQAELKRKLSPLSDKTLSSINHAGMRRCSQFNAMLNDVLLLFDDLILLRMIRLGSRNAGGHS